MSLFSSGGQNKLLSSPTVDITRICQQWEINFFGETWYRVITLRFNRTNSISWTTPVPKRSFCPSMSSMIWHWFDISYYYTWFSSRRGWVSRWGCCIERSLVDVVSEKEHWAFTCGIKEVYQLTEGLMLPSPVKSEPFSPGNSCNRGRAIYYLE